MGKVFCRESASFRYINIDQKTLDFPTQLKKFFKENQSNGMTRDDNENIKQKNIFTHSYLQNQMNSNHMIDFCQNVLSIFNMRDIHQITQENLYSTLLFIYLFDAQSSHTFVRTSPSRSILSTHLKYADILNDRINNLLYLNSNDLLNEKQNKFSVVSSPFSSKELVTSSSFFQTFNLNDSTEDYDAKSKSSSMGRASTFIKQKSTKGIRPEGILKEPLNKINESETLEREGSELEKIEQTLKKEIQETVRGERVTAETQKKEKVIGSNNTNKKGRYIKQQFASISDNPHQLRQKRISYSASLQGKNLKRFRANSNPKKPEARVYAEEIQVKRNREENVVLEESSAVEEEEIILNTSDPLNMKHGQSFINYLRENLSPNRREVKPKLKLSKHRKKEKKKMNNKYAINIREIAFNSKKDKDRAKDKDKPQQVAAKPRIKNKKSIYSEMPTSHNLLSLNCNDNFIESVERYLEVDCMKNRSKKKSHMKNLSTCLMNNNNIRSGYSRPNAMHNIPQSSPASGFQNKIIPVANANQMNTTVIDSPDTAIEKLLFDNPNWLMPCSSPSEMSCTNLSQNEDITSKPLQNSNKEDENANPRKVSTLVRHFTFK